jgi:DNA repair exonuclease SbcCD nuclease subunit
MIGDELFVTAFIADIHFGSMKSDNLYQQLQERFMKVISKNKIDLIVFGGDMFHSIITMNYSTSQYVLLFMERVLDICVKNKIKHVRIIQGTMSHDNNQLNNFHIYENRTDVDFRIIRTLSEEELPEGIKILYVPEEYMSNARD